jgi:hypothetical protein
VCNELRKALAMPMGGNRSGGAKVDHERAKGTLASLLNFSARQAGGRLLRFHEKRGKDGIAYTLKRSRYSLDVPGLQEVLDAECVGPSVPLPLPRQPPCIRVPGPARQQPSREAARRERTSDEGQAGAERVAAEWRVAGFAAEAGGHRDAVATNKESRWLDVIKAKIEKALPGAEIVHLTRGPHQGHQRSGECTLA